MHYKYFCNRLQYFLYFRSSLMKEIGIGIIGTSYIGKLHSLDTI